MLEVLEHFAAERAIIHALSPAKVRMDWALAAVLAGLRPAV